MKIILATILLVSASSRIDAEFFVSVDTTLIGDEEVLGEIVEIIKRELNNIDDITVIESPEQAEITLRFHIAQIVTEAGLYYGSVLHMSVLVPFQSDNAGRQLLYIADDMDGAPADGYESLVRDMIHDFDDLMENSR